MGTNKIEYGQSIILWDYNSGIDLEQQLNDYIGEERDIISVIPIEYELKMNGSLLSKALVVIKPNANFKSN